MKKILLLFAVVSLCACGCHTTKATADGTAESATAAQESDTPLRETKWVLVSLNSEPLKDAPEVPYIIFSGDRMTGCLGCNSFFGTFFANRSGKISFKYDGSTKRLCNAMELEYDFISALQSERTTYVIVKDMLIIRAEKTLKDGTKKEVEVLRFKADKEN
ncbi:MAG: META domain-containing protein [Bacteroidales bacterium]|nr:META domain-containing protein [Bacteroidales bacterium]